MQDRRSKTYLVFSFVLSRFVFLEHYVSFLFLLTYFNFFLGCMLWFARFFTSSRGPNVYYVPGMAGSFAGGGTILKQVSFGGGG